MAERNSDYFDRAWREYLNLRRGTSTPTNNRESEPGVERARVRNLEPNRRISPDANPNSRRPRTYVVDTEDRETEPLRPRLSGGDTHTDQRERIYAHFRNRQRQSRNQPGENQLESLPRPDQLPTPFGFRGTNRTGSGDSNEFRGRQMEIQQSRREYEENISRQRQRREGREDSRSNFERSFNAIWRESVEESVEELRRAQERRRRREENLRDASSSQTPNPNGDIRYIPNWQLINEERREARQLQRQHLESISRPISETEQSPPEPNQQNSSQGESLELHSKYLGEFTLGLVKKGRPSITLDQAILEAERESRSEQGVCVSAPGSTEGLLLLRGAGDGRQNQSPEPSTSSSMTLPIPSPNPANSAERTQARPESGNSPEGFEIRLRELRENLNRLQTVINQCENNRLYLEGIQQVLTDTNIVLEKARNPPGTSASPDTSTPNTSLTPTPPTSIVEANPNPRREFCLSIWEAVSPADLLGTSGSSLPVVEAYVTELPTGTGVRTAEQAQQEEEAEADVEDEIDDEESSSSSSSETDEEYNAWDAHSTMRNFTESTFNIDSDWEDHADESQRRVGELGDISSRFRIQRVFPRPSRITGISTSGTGNTRRRQRDISPATREFNRSIGIRNSGDEDEGAFSDFIMMPNPRGPDNSLGDETPLPLLPDNLERVVDPEVRDDETSDESEEQDSEEEEMEGGQSSESENNNGEEENVTDEEAEIDEEVCIAGVEERVSLSPENEDKEPESESSEEDENELCRNLFQHPPIAVGGGGWFRQLGHDETNIDLDLMGPLSDLSATPFVGTPPPKVQLDEGDVEIERVLNKLKREEHEAYLVYVQNIRKTDAAESEAVESRLVMDVNIAELEPNDSHEAADENDGLERIPNPIAKEDSGTETLLTENIESSHGEGYICHEVPPEFENAPPDGVVRNENNPESPGFEDTRLVEVVMNEKDTEPTPVTKTSLKELTPVEAKDPNEKMEININPEPEVDLTENDYGSGSHVDDANISQPEEKLKQNEPPPKKESGFKVFYHKVSTRISSITKKASLTGPNKISPKKKVENQKKKNTSASESGSNTTTTAELSGAKRNDKLQ